ncbi:MAG: hypothetical protein A4S09_09945 [Proteobacteria bacterium SG_bin7]|nr:MAG: hypothetical protein A4S09_09945 [Proteobacteria bacterium SG_bin7]
MRTRFKVLGLLLVLVSGIACDKSAKRIEVTQRLARGQSVYMNIVDDQMGLLNVNNSGFWGDVTGNVSLSPEQFNTQWRGLMSATLTPDKMGNVSSYAGGHSGVRLQGGIRASFSGGMISNVDLPTAQIRIAIWDSIAGTADSNGKIIPEYPIHLIGATGVAAGNQVNLTFSDAYGSISIAGTIQGGLFQGSISFQNLVNLSGGTYPQSGPLGNITINVCDFFVCN